MILIAEFFVLFSLYGAGLWVSVGAILHPNEVIKAIGIWGVLVMCGSLYIGMDMLIGGA